MLQEDKEGIGKLREKGGSKGLRGEMIYEFRHKCDYMIRVGVMIEIG